MLQQKWNEQTCWQRPHIRRPECDAQREWDRRFQREMILLRCQGPPDPEEDKRETRYIRCCRLAEVENSGREEECDKRDRGGGSINAKSFADLTQGVKGKRTSHPRKSN